MALDKVIDSSLLDAGMKATADAIREKTGSTDPIVWDSANGFKTAVEGIQAGGGDDESFKAVLEGTAVNPTLPADLTKIKDFMFYECRNLSLASLPSGVTSIGSSAFYACSNLALTSLPDSLTSVGSQAFYWSGLTLTSLPDSLTSIGGSAFEGCQKLTFTSIPASVTSIGNSAFNYCTGLTEITFNGTPTSIGGSAFQSCNNLKTINVPWAEGEVANAPWAARYATINYNYTGG